MRGRCRRCFRRSWETKRLLDSDRSMTVQEATERRGPKPQLLLQYMDDILPLSDNTKGKTVTLVTQMNDEPGLSSDLLHVVATGRANILTIHQTIPVNGVATVTLRRRSPAGYGECGEDDGRDRRTGREFMTSGF